MFVIFISKHQPPTAHCNERKYFSFDDELHLPAMLADVSISKHLSSSHIGADTGHCTLDGQAQRDSIKDTDIYGNRENVVIVLEVPHMLLHTSRQ